MRYAQLCNAIADQPFPCAVLDLDAFDHNLAAMAARAGGKPIRLASKSIRVPALMRRALDANRSWQGLLCFSVPEAIQLANLGFDDIVVAYPTCQPAALEALAAAVKAGRQIVPMADCDAHLQALSQAAERLDTRLEVAFDLDMSFDLPGLRFGVYRSPLNDVEKTLRLYQQLNRFPRLQLVGVMGYEAQIAGVGDAVPGKLAENQIVRLLKQWATPKVAARRQAIVAALRAAGAALRFVNGGGTGSLESTAADASITEIGAGSGLYTPTLFDYYRHFQHQPAAFFALEACRASQADSITCQGGGYIASGAAATLKLPSPVWPEGLAFNHNEAAGEVQTPLFGTELPALGSPILFRPAKSGEYLDRFDEVLLVSGEQVQGKATTYRGKGWRFF